MCGKVKQLGATSKELSFELTDELTEALEVLAGNRTVRLSGRLNSNGDLVIDNIGFARDGTGPEFAPVNAPFVNDKLSKSFSPLELI